MSGLSDRGAETISTDRQARTDPEPLPNPACSYRAHERQSGRHPCAATTKPTLRYANVIVQGFGAFKPAGDALIALLARCAALIDLRRDEQAIDSFSW